MLSCGCVWLGASERGAFGFSNEKSLTYWPSTLSCGAGSAAAAAGLRAAGAAVGRERHDRLPPPADSAIVGGVANTAAPGGTRMADGLRALCAEARRYVLPAASGAVTGRRVRQLGSCRARRRRLWPVRFDTWCHSCGQVDDRGSRGRRRRRRDAAIAARSPPPDCRDEQQRAQRRR